MSSAKMVAMLLVKDWHIVPGRSYWIHSAAFSSSLTPTFLSVDPTSFLPPHPSRQHKHALSRQVPSAFKMGSSHWIVIGRRESVTGDVSMLTGMFFLPLSTIHLSIPKSSIKHWSIKLLKHPPRHNARFPPAPGSAGQRPGDPGQANTGPTK